MKLNAGERIELTESNKYFRVISGEVEAYAVTAGDASFRQFYLSGMGAGDAAFPALDEFGEINVVLSAVEDAELEESSFDETSDETLRLLMQVWFKRLGEIPWLRLLAEKGDDILQSWRDGTVLQEAETHDALMEAFTESEQIFAMFLGIRFGSEDKRLSRRMKVRAWAKKMLVAKRSFITTRMAAKAGKREKRFSSSPRLRKRWGFPSKLFPSPLTWPSGSIR